MTAGGSILDASALLAFLQNEPGAMVVDGILRAGAVISAVNLAEVLSKVAAGGGDPEATDRSLASMLQVIPLTAADSLAIARLQGITRAQGLSLGDRACLALGQKTGRPVVTSDRIWANLNLPDVRVQLIR